MGTPWDLRGVSFAYNFSLIVLLCLSDKSSPNKLFLFFRSQIYLYEKDIFDIIGKQLHKYIHKEGPNPNAQQPLYNVFLLRY